MASTFSVVGNSDRAKLSEELCMFVEVHHREQMCQADQKQHMNGINSCKYIGEGND